MFFFASIFSLTPALYKAVHAWARTSRRTYSMSFSTGGRRFRKRKVTGIPERNLGRPAATKLNKATYWNKPQASSHWNRTRQRTMKRKPSAGGCSGKRRSGRDGVYKPFAPR